MKTLKMGSALILSLSLAACGGGKSGDPSGSGASPNGNSSISVASSIAALSSAPVSSSAPASSSAIMLSSMSMLSSSGGSSSMSLASSMSRSSSMSLASSMSRSSSMSLASSPSSSASSSSRVSSSSVAATSSSSMSYSSHSSGPCTGSACTEPTADWYTDKANDQAGTHHVPTGTDPVMNDLHADHITPFGGWFTYSSPKSENSDSEKYLCWSTSATALDTLSGVNAAIAANHCQTQSEFLAGKTAPRKGIKDFPIIVMQLEPDTIYYFRLLLPDNYGVQRLSNVVSFKTRPDPRKAFNSVHPKVFYTQSQIDAMKTRYNNNDSRIAFWINNDEARARQSAAANTNVGGAWAYGVPAFIMGKVKNDNTLIDAAKTILLTHLLPPYEVVLTGNDYRWNTPHLATLTDLLWGNLSPSERARILDAILLQDERASNLYPRFTDTDEFTALTQIQIAHGLTFLGSTDLDPAKLARLEKVFDIAIRRWYGGLLVKARRGDDLWGMAGGTMDDGAAYGVSTRRYWLETFTMLENAGYPQGEYAPWIWNVARAHVIYPLVPNKSGIMTFGDFEHFQTNGTAQVIPAWDSDPLEICLLNRYGWQTEAGYVRDALTKTRNVEPNSGPEQWAMICDDPQVVAKDYTQLPTVYRANGYGLVYDRTDWSTNASYLMFSAGWRGVDHSHKDVGHFSLWSNGAFLTTEHPDYGEGKDDNVYQHNILLQSGAEQHFPITAKILKAVSTADYLYVLTDMTSGYNPDFSGGEDDVRGPSQVHSSVTRSLYWDKKSNVVVVYDRVVGGTDHTMTQNILGSPSLYPTENVTLSLSEIQSAGLGTLLVTKLLNEINGDTRELLMIVNGTGTLSTTSTTRGVAGLVSFSRSTGEIQ